MNRGLLKEHASLLDAALRIFDPLLVAATALIAYRIYLGDWNPPSRYVAAAAIAALFAAAVLPVLDLYRSQRGTGFVDEVARLVFAWLLLGAAGAAYFFLTKSGAVFSRGWAVIWIAGGLALHITSRAALRMTLRALRRRGQNLRHIVIVGARAHGRSVAARLRAAAWTGFVVHAFYEDDPSLIGTSQDGIPVRGPLARLSGELIASPVDQVWIALPLSDEARIRDCVEGLRQTPVVVRFVPNFYGFRLLNHSIGEVAGMPVVSLADTPFAGVRGLWKAVEDIALSAALLVMLAPVLALIAVGVKLSSPGPALYRQQRVTWTGKRFVMLKFRSMAVDAEAQSGPVWSAQDDARATRFGGFLRRFSLDELPQLVNVLRGEMSLVGPRPERPEFVARFRDRVPGYMQKHLVKAGITGWAQVNDLRGDSDLALRIQYDLYYVEHWSPWFDLRILALTFWHILTTRNAH